MHPVHPMLPKHAKAIGLVFAFQLIFMLALEACRHREWVRSEWVWLLGGYVIPLVAYIVVLYVARMFPRMWTAPRMVCLTVTSFAMTMAGMMIITVLWVALSLITGQPIRR